MSEENPPIIPIFNGLYYNSQFFNDVNNGLSVEQLSNYFLKYPSAQGTETLQAVNINGISQLYDNLTMKNATSSKRIITCGDFKLDDNSLSSGSPILQIYSTGNTNYYKSLVSDNTSSINFQLKNTGGTNITSLQLTPLSVTSNVGLTANQGITVNNQPSTFNSGLNVYGNSVFSGTVNIASGQSIVVNNASTINFLATSVLNMTSSSIAQSGTVGNTLGAINMIANNGVFFPSGSGIINQTVTNATDANFLKKTNVLIDSGSSTGAAVTSFVTYDNNAGADGRGFFFVPNSGSGSYNGIIQLGDSAIVGRNTAGSANAICLSCFSTDRIGIRINGRIVNAPTIELSTTSTNVILMDKDKTNFNQKALFRAGLSTSDIINHIASGGTETTAMTLNATQTRFDLPIAFANSSYPTARTSSQLGFVNFATIAGVNVTSSSSVRYLGSLSPGSIQVNSGVWRIDIGYSFAPITTNSTITNLSLGMNIVSTAIPSSGALAPSVFKPEIINLNAGSYYSVMVSGSVVNSNSGVLISVYPVYILEFIGATNFTIGCNYTVTRIG